MPPCQGGDQPHPRTTQAPSSRLPLSFFSALLGFELAYGGPGAHFTSLRAGPGAYLNLVHSDRPVQWWGRAIFWVDDVDAVHRRALEAGYSPHAEPKDATWGERYFHITDPAGHEISIARPLE